MTEANHVDIHNNILWFIPASEHSDGTGEYWCAIDQQWVTSEISDAFVQTLIPIDTQPKLSAAIPAELLEMEEYIKGAVRIARSERGDSYDVVVQIDRVFAELHEALDTQPVMPTAEPAKVKPVYFMRMPMIIPAPQLWPSCEGGEGEFVANGFKVHKDGGLYPYPTRTSLIVKIDLEAGHIETLNSIYKIV